MECPNPQPGQKLKPKFFIGQSVKCDSEGLLKPNQTNPPIQKNNSMFSFCNISFDSRCWDLKSIFLSYLSSLCGCKGWSNFIHLVNFLHKQSFSMDDQDVLQDEV